ncbi:MAG: cyclic lactone autoinducer peptide [Lachnospiraceae bacterium]|nr:cyclic lactone autoinducer peptide [Lachnospiraceae bacterium]
MKKKIDKKVLKAVERVARNEVIRNMSGWPPLCGGLLHQPMRPQKKQK